MLSDLIGGYMVYVLPTFLIKGLVALVAWKLCRKDQPLLALLSFLLAEAVMVLGYFLLEWALYGVASAAAAIRPECGAGHRGRADWDAVPADCAPAGARREAVTNRDANGFPLWKTLASFSMMQKNLLMGDKSGGKCAIIVYWKGIPFPQSGDPMQGNLA